MRISHGEIQRNASQRSSARRSCNGRATRNVPSPEGGMSEQPFAWHVGVCPQCERPNRTVGPLHGAQGGPLSCLQCGMEWHAKYGHKRKSGRIVIKAMQMFFKAGGEWRDINKLVLRAQAADVGLGYLFGQADTIGCDVGDITTELLRDTLRLTHPDVHPPERRELAGRVTAELRALEPTSFPRRSRMSRATLKSRHQHAWRESRCRR